MVVMEVVLVLIYIVSGFARLNNNQDQEEFLAFHNNKRLAYPIIVDSLPSDEGVYLIESRTFGNKDDGDKYAFVNSITIYTILTDYDEIGLYSNRFVDRKTCHRDYMFAPLEGAVKTAVFRYIDMIYIHPDYLGVSYRILNPYINTVGFLEQTDRNNKML